MATPVRVDCDLELARAADAVRIQGAGERIRVDVPGLGAARRLGASFPGRARRRRLRSRLLGFV